MRPSGGEPSELLAARSSQFKAGTSWRRRLTIAHQLGLLIVGLQLFLMVLLAAYFGDRQVKSMSTRLRAKAETFAALVSTQVRSAVAFNDRETAREAFDALGGDPDLSGILLFDSHGRLLERRGSPSDLALRASRGVSSLRVFEMPDRLLVVSPVQSLEGPRGMIAFELTKSNLFAARRATIGTALLASLLALALGATLASLIARSFGRRLRAIAAVASRVAAGDLSPQAVIDERDDEIGSLANSVATMLEQLRRLIADIERQAEREQARLEGLVQQRTAELASRNDDLRRLLDTVGQGFLTLDRDARMSKERSAILASWLGAAPDSALFPEYIGQVSPGLRREFEVAWEQVLDGVLPLELTIEQLPRRLSIGTRELEIAYKPICDSSGRLERVLVVLSDVTAVLERTRVEAQERDLLNLFSRLLEDRAAGAEFVWETDEIIDRLVQGGEDQASTLRLLHTLKGNAALFGLDSLAAFCHALEDQLGEPGSELSMDELQRLRSGWQRTTNKVMEFMAPASERDASIALAEAEHREYLNALRRGAPHAELLARAQAWSLEPTEVRLRRLCRQAECLAARLGKAPLEVRIESNGVRMDSDGWLDVWSSLPHLIRNAVDHGIETAAERAAAGKPAPAQIALRTLLTAQEFSIEVEDTGRGVDWSAVERAAQRRGLTCRTRRELEAALFADGVSTREAAGLYSGRGVGTAVVAAAVRASGGVIDVESVTGQGTRFRMRWPVARAKATVVSEARRRASAAQPLSYDRVG
jgi:two-component system chemotaxis sensor kinase CheA